MTASRDLTRNQSKVLGALERARAPLSAYALLDRLRDDGFRAPLQVYRALDALTKAGLAHRLESLNAFVACAGGHAHPHDHEHAVTGFAICERCGQVTEFTDAALKERLDLSVAGFNARSAVVEVRGLCAACASADA